jgi:phenylacetate-CoA ligase
LTGASFWIAADAIPTLRVLRAEPSEIELLARHRLSRLLLHAARHNPFYSQRLQDAGIERDDPVLLRDPFGALAAIPPVSKLELRQAGSRILNRGQTDGRWYSSHSSGSTGEPFRVYYTPRAWAALKYLVKLRARWRCGLKLTDRVALLDAIPPATPPFGQRLHRRWSRISVLQPASAVAAGLEGFAPHIVYGLPSALVEAGRVLRQTGTRIPVRAVFTSGELLQRASRDELVSAFQAPVFDVYGTSETKEIAWQCSRGSMHLNADVVSLEAVDDLGRNLPSGTEGDLVATVLVNHAMPLLRYRTGDRGTLLSGRCSCGCSFPLLGVVTGRAADTLVFRHGHRVSPYALTCAIERIPGIVRYQVSQLEPARVRVRAILEGTVDRAAITAQLQTALRFGVASYLDADVEFVDRLPTGPRAKFRVVEPLQPAETP